MSDIRLPPPPNPICVNLDPKGFQTEIGEQKFTYSNALWQRVPFVKPLGSCAYPPSRHELTITHKSARSTKTPIPRPLPPLCKGRGENFASIAPSRKLGGGWGRVPARISRALAWKLALRKHVGNSKIEGEGQDVPPPLVAERAKVKPG